jgi:hypothetical protein
MRNPLRPDGLASGRKTAPTSRSCSNTTPGTEHLPSSRLRRERPDQPRAHDAAPVLLPHPRREQTARRAIAATAASHDLQIATTALDPRATCPACAAAWMPLHGGHPPMRLIDVADVLPRPLAHPTR